MKLHTLLEAASYFIGNNKARENINGVLINSNDESITIVATDRCQLIEIQYKWNDDNIFQENVENMFINASDLKKIINISKITNDYSETGKVMYKTNSYPNIGNIKHNYEESIALNAFNPTYLGKAFKAINLINKNYDKYDGNYVSFYGKEGSPLLIKSRSQKNIRLKFEIYIMPYNM